MSVAEVLPPQAHRRLMTELPVGPVEEARAQRDAFGEDIIDALTRGRFEISWTTIEEPYTKPETSSMEVSLFSETGDVETLRIHFTAAQHRHQTDAALEIVTMEGLTKSPAHRRYYVGQGMMDRLTADVRQEARKHAAHPRPR